MEEIVPNCYANRNIKSLEEPTLASMVMMSLALSHRHARLDHLQWISG